MALFAVDYLCVFISVIYTGISVVYVATNHNSPHTITDK